MFENTQIAFASKSDSALRKANFLFLILKWNKLANIGIYLLKIAIKFALPIKLLIKKTIFSQFCGGESIAECLSVMNSLNEYRINTILDYAVEAESNEITAKKNLHIFKKLILIDAEKEEIRFSVIKITSILNLEILQKLQQKEELTKEQSEQYYKTVSALHELFELAQQNNVKLMIDAEESWIQSSIDSIAIEGMKKYNTNTATLFNTYQMYRKDQLNVLAQDILNAKNNGYQLGIKLVRGAYLEKEKARAIEYNYPNPICDSKEATDQQFDEALKLCIEYIDTIELCCGSHNEESNAYLTKLLDNARLAKNNKKVFFAQLYGMSDHISYNLANMGYNVAKYLPFGPVKSVIPYLIRRAQENKSIAGQSGRELSLINQEIKRRRYS
ncbi:MAG: proline dehydrogenase [Cytophagales bacterium]|nr:MAG: proline dehydrogenase [Cytophagales bacterium]